MLVSIELQVISKILTSDDDSIIDELCSYDSSYYSVYKRHIEFLLDHRNKYGDIPSTFTFLSQFAEEDINIVDVREPVEYLVSRLKQNKKRILFVETFNKIKTLGEDDIEDAWKYLGMQCELADALDNSNPMNIIAESEERAQQVVDWSKQAKIPTGFPEIDKLMYGGLSTVEEFLIILARTNTGKSWICTRMMEAAQSAGFPVAYYSPEMQSAFLATRFDTWRGHYANSQIFRGIYSEEYKQYIKELKSDNTPAFIIEDKDMADGVSVKKLEPFVKKHGIKLLIIDGLSYMADDEKSERDYEKFKHIASGLFKLSKKFGCAVVVAMQANRETKALADDKGPALPTLYESEGSDHPGRICTQAFAVRQIFDKHVLDIRLEKSRNAANAKPVLSYAIDFNTGSMQFLPGDATDDESNTLPSKPTGPNIPAIPNSIIKTTNGPASDLSLDLDGDDDIEF